MEYISRQHVPGGIGKVVHTLATKLGMSLSCITPAKYDVKGAEQWRFISVNLLPGTMDTCSHASGLSIGALPGSCLCSEPGCEQIEHDCTWSVYLTLRLLTRIESPSPKCA